MQYSFIIGENFSVFAKTEAFMDNDALMAEIKQKEPDIIFSDDPHLQCVFPITAQEYEERNQAALVKRISENLDAIIADMNDNKGMHLSEARVRRSEGFRR